jgi:DNA-binding NarL/FixJ family response regulator
MKHADSTRTLAQRSTRHRRRTAFEIDTRPQNTNGTPSANHSIRVVVVGGERLFREALRALLNEEDAVAIVGEAADGVEGIGLIRRLQPHVVLLDLAMPEMEQAELMQNIKRGSPDTKSLLITPVADDARLCRALKAGAQGYVSKNASGSDLRNAVHGIVRGELWVERRLIGGILNGEQFTGTPVSQRAAGSLTDREREILRSLTSGGTNRDIAETLSISEKTVKTHLNNIFRKLNVARRLEAVLFAIRQGLS